MAPLQGWAARNPAFPTSPPKTIGPPEWHEGETLEAALGPQSIQAGRGVRRPSLCAQA